jgi:glucose/mannose-6-phosphate isomerase
MMVDLDDLTAHQELDPEGMLGHVAALPQQCRDAWTATRRLQLPVRHLRAEKILIVGMGGSAIGGDLAVAVAMDESPIPILVQRGYGVPAYVDRETMVIVSSYSGNTEETVSGFQAASERGCPVVAITTDGQVAEMATEQDVPLVSFDYRSQPRAALGYMFVSLLGVLRAMGVVSNLDADLDEAVAILDAQEAELGANVPQAENRAKQLATELAGQVPVVVGSGPLEPVARRWKTQFNENAKTWAYFEPLPEMNHNAVSGIHFPGEMAGRMRVLFLSNPGLHPRNHLRLELTRQVFEEQGIACHAVAVQGKSAVAQILSAIQMGDYTSCYLALLNGTDPTAIGDIAALKQRMSDA